MDFGMRPAGELVGAATDDHPVGIKHQCANHRVGGRPAAAALGEPLAVFPSHHGGFLGGEFGQRGEPEAFAARLREILAAGG
jgi:hypothetical protein